MVKAVFQCQDGSTFGFASEAHEHERAGAFCAYFLANFTFWAGSANPDAPERRQIAQWLVDNERQVLELLNYDTGTLGDEGYVARKNPS